MKILLDENLPHALRHDLIGHDVATVSYMGWSGLTNGTLLKQAALTGFEVMVTVDRGIETQHNLHELPMSIIVIKVVENTVQVLRPMIPALLAALEQLQPKSLFVLEANTSTN
jgi:predicted nuclease of predicted toxin-antitoxin system